MNTKKLKSAILTSLCLGMVTVPLLPTVGCGGVDVSTCENPVDADGDGDPVCSNADAIQDCNDDDATINNGAEETAGDGIDSDCDGADDPVLNG